MDLILNSNVIDMDFTDKLNELIKDNISLLNLNRKHTLTIQYNLRNTIFADPNNIVLKNNLLESLNNKIKEHAKHNKLSLQSVVFQEDDNLNNILINLEEEKILFKDIGLYHKDIHKKHETLFVTVTLDCANLLTDDIAYYLRNFLTDNKLPFEQKSTYEVCIYYNYFESDIPSNTEENVNMQIDKIKDVMAEFKANIDIYFVYGDKTDKQYEVKIEIDEKPPNIKRPSNTFIMLDNEIREQLIKYFEKFLLKEFLDSPQPEKKGKLYLKAYNGVVESYNRSIDISEELINKYKWAVGLDKNYKNDLRIFDRKDNSFIHFGGIYHDSQCWTTSKFTKIFDRELLDDLLGSIDEMRGQGEKIFHEYFKKLNELKYLAILVDLPEDSNFKTVYKKFIDDFHKPSQEQLKALDERYLIACKKRGQDNRKPAESPETIAKRKRAYKLITMIEDCESKLIEEVEYDETKKIKKEEKVEFYCFEDAQKITFQSGEVVYRYYHDQRNVWLTFKANKGARLG